MVPHRKALRAIALASHCAPVPAVALKRLCELHHVKFPCQEEVFWKEEILAYLPPELEALFLTTDTNTTSDYRPMLLAASKLGLANVIQLDENGPTVKVSADVLKWRKNQTIRVALDTMLLCGVSIAQICEDFRTMYQQTFTEDDVTYYAAMYVDRDYAEGEGWALYAEQIGIGEATFKKRLMQQPVDYVRHSLGVAVHLDPDQVLNRLMSDAYFACLQLSADSGTRLSKDDIARIKFEKDTIFKAMDRITKHKEASGGNSVTKAADAISKIALKYTESKHPLLSELDTQ